MSKRLSPGVLEQMFASGELERRAREMPADATQSDFARSLGISPDAYVCARIRWRKQGKRLPSFEELRSTQYRDSDTHIGAPTNLVGTSSKLVDTDREESEPQASRSELRRQSIQRGEPMPRWPNVEAFERGVDAVPDGHAIKGVSSYVVDGEIRGQWIKTSVSEPDNVSVVLDAIRNIANEWPAIASPIEPPQHSDDDLLCVYPMGDPHIGMLACRAETGEEFNLEIAERNLYAAVDHLALLAPPAKRAIVATVGDTFHSDGLSNTTTKGTRVDVDSRTFKMIDVGVRTFRRVIERALDRHDEVEVKIAPGNHDALISIMLRVALQQFFEKEPRVRVDPSPEDFLWYKFGANLLGFNHGHRASADALMQVMAVDRAADWGVTRHRRIYKGHVHHETTKEVPGCTMDTLNTLASSDDWHRRQGYRATRHMRMDIFHREFGFINRHIVGIDQLMRGWAA